MNRLLNPLLDQLQSLAASHPALAIAILVFGGIIVCMVAYLRLNYFLREKAITLNDKRFAPLLGILNKEKLTSIHPLKLELIFQRAYGFRLNSDEIKFALAHRHTSDVLFDIRYGRAFLRLNKSKSGYEIQNEHWISLRMRQKLTTYIVCWLLIPAILFTLIYTFVEPAIGLTFLFELGCCFWGMVVLSRSLACAQRLLLLLPLPQANADPILPDVASVELARPKMKRTPVKQRVKDENVADIEKFKEDAPLVV